MAEDSVTVQVLKEIRDEVRQTNERLDQTNERLDQTNERLDRTRTELSGRLGHVESALVELAEQQRFVVRWLKAKGERDRRLEGEVAVLRSRVDAIEDRLPADD